MARLEMIHDMRLESLRIHLRQLRVTLDALLYRRNPPLANRPHLPRLAPRPLVAPTEALMQRGDRILGLLPERGRLAADDGDELVQGIKDLLHVLLHHLPERRQVEVFGERGDDARAQRVQRGFDVGRGCPAFAFVLMMLRMRVRMDLGRDEGDGRDGVHLRSQSRAGWAKNDVRRLGLSGPRQETASALAFMRS